MRAVVAFARANGWDVTETRGGHLAFRRPGGGLVYGSRTPGDGRSAANTRAQLRRAMRK
jgi:hypothetical protein